MLVLDTSLLVDTLTGPRRSLGNMRAAIARGERLLVPALTLYEWLRGPRDADELARQAELFPTEAALPFGPEEAARAAALYSAVPRARGREIDLGIAAHALVLDAALWTLNPSDFVDIPGLDLVQT